MLSGIGPKEELEKHGIPIIKELQVGYNLQDHVSVLTHIVFNESISWPVEKYVIAQYTLKALKGTQSANLLSLSECC